MRTGIRVSLTGIGRKRPWIAKALGIDINSKYGIRRDFLPVIIKTKNVYFFEIVEQGLYEMQEPFKLRTYWQYTKEKILIQLTPEEFIDLLPSIPETDFFKMLENAWFFN